MKHVLKYGMIVLVMIAFFASMTTETVFAATLKKGSKGNEVGWLQKNLTGIGFPCDVDNVFGSDTRKSVKEAQRYFGIKVDGIAGKQTQACIGELVADIQSDLKTLGYDIKVDEKFGKATEKAVKAFQKENALEVTGVADEATREIMKEVIQEESDLRNTSENTLELDLEVNSEEELEHTSEWNVETNSESRFDYTKVKSNVRTYSLKKNGKENITDNFKVREFACKDGSNTILIDDKWVVLLQNIREHFGKPVIINSAYRTEKHNENVGGAANSYHLYGKAADLQIKGVSPQEIALYTESLGVKGIGLYGTSVHVDTRTSKYYWDTEGQVASFYEKYCIIQ